MKDKPLYVISVVSELLNIHPQTLRQYERIELVKPSRTIGNVRLYSEEDIEKLRFITTLTRDMGVNLAGVEIILKMREQIEELKSKLDEMANFIREHINTNDQNVPIVKPAGNIIKVKIERE
ncbi:MAG: helix-turn-helix transcriptional regulator [Calditerrivibrio sp.]|nr:helix-turn-helix transcriptional regulator [Calditerrivibrio sp.]MCA1933392.1 helix-turn-helix transcriptional regulator [Calditerrivibrio sp.]